MPIEIEYLPLEKISQYQNNARTHSDSQVEQIKRSIEEFGFTNPILIDEENVIIAGHGRLQAAESMGLADIPTIRLNGLTDAQKRAYVIADNKLALNAGWDVELLSIELSDLSAEAFDLSLIGFDKEELDVLLVGWSSDIDLEEKDGKHTDGIMAIVKFRVAQHEKDESIDLIKNALEQAGIEYEF